ncbi:MAG: SiaB family protein kinase [Bacteroidales bacterium]
MTVTKDSKGFLEFVYEFYKSMKTHEITLVYEGEVTHQLTKAFTTLTETNMSKEEESNAVQRKVFHVMVECLQNISKHADEIPGYDNVYAGRGNFPGGKSDDKYSVTTGNMIENARVDEMKKMLEHINSLDKGAQRTV